MKNKKIACPPHAHPAAPQGGWQAFRLAAPLGSPFKAFSLAALACVLAVPSTAQVRVYDASSGQSVTQGGTSGASSGSVGGIRTESTGNRPTRATPPAQPATRGAATAPATGGVRVDPPASSGTASTPTRGINATSVNQGNAATPARPSTPLSNAAASTSGNVSSTPKNSAYVPDRVVTDALGNPILTSAQKSSTTPVKLGDVIVFVNVSEFSPIVSKRIEELQKVPGIAPYFYMEERRPQEYIALLGADFFNVSSKISFRSDAGGAMAEAYGVKKSHTIVYRLPNGSVRKYSLVSEMPVFLDQLERIRKGEST